MTPERAVEEYTKLLNLLLAQEAANIFVPNRTIEYTRMVLEREKAKVASQA